MAKYVLADLAADGLLPSQLRVLDVGAGVGGPAVALRDLLPDDALLDYHAVEPSAAADVRNVCWRTAARTSAGRFTGHSPRSSTRRRRLSATTAVVGPETGTAVATTAPTRDTTSSSSATSSANSTTRRRPSTGTSRRLPTTGRAGAGPRRPELGHSAPNCRARGGRRRPGDGVWADRATVARPRPATRMVVRPRGGYRVPTVQQRLDDPAGGTGEFVKRTCSSPTASCEPTASECRCNTATGAITRRWPRWSATSRTASTSSR